MSALPLGIDVSHHNGPVDWGAAARSGLAFAYAKATEGATVIDDRFAVNWAAIRDAGLFRGAYHFFHPATPVEQQADHFVSTVGQLAPGDLPPMLDLEETSQSNDEWPHIEPARRVPLALQWLERVEQALGRKPVVYTRRGFVRATLGEAGRLVEHPVWIAHYTLAPKPAVPPGWAKWTLWQYTDSGRVAGITSNVDKNRFNGSLGELRVLASLSADAATAGSDDAT
jgi:lysozyme